MLSSETSNPVESSSVSDKGETNKCSVALLYQAIDPPVINGVKKPAKPGGYIDSGADIAFSLQQSNGCNVVTSDEQPDPAKHAGWAFPDHLDGINSALKKGANVLWTNTIMFSEHPLAADKDILESYPDIKVVGQPPAIVNMFDDKAYTNDLLRKTGRFTMPSAWTISADDPKHKEILASIPLPAVGKPVRGRGSHGVKVVRTLQELVDHVEALFKESPIVLVEEFLAGEEATVSVLPPTGTQGYRALPAVIRTNHIGDIAPYNGVVAVTANSRAVRPEEADADAAYARAGRECENVAELLGCKAVMRIDVRRRKAGGDFVLFDVNMKPNMTGPGRPGRDDQACLTLLAAEAIGWDYKKLLLNMLGSAVPIKEWRSIGVGKYQ